MASADDKNREKVQFLMRFFWIDEIHKLGKDLNIPYFNRFKNYWDIDYDKGYEEAASEIAKMLSDDELVRIVQQKSPSFRLKELGGFQGNYYSATQSGQVKIEGSWDNVRINTKKALENWKDQAYGVLKAIINKGGRSAYFDLIDAIEKVLGRDFVPSYLLPRLGPLKLVFKTGSNKYPDWTMPPEIIPVVQEELLKYESTPKGARPKRTTIEKDASAQPIQSEGKVKDMVNRIMKTRQTIELLFDSYYKGKAKLFEQDEMAVLEILKLCANEDDFNNRIQSLSNIIARIRSNDVKSQIKTQRSNLNGSIDILEAWLKEAQPSHDTRIIKNLRMIQRLRNTKIHEGMIDFTKTIQYFGFTFPVTDWQALWEATLRKYLEALEGLETLLESMNH